MKSKYYSPLFGLTVLAMGFTGVDFSQANTTTSDDIYSDSLYITRSSAEIPSSFESSARETLAQGAIEPDTGTERVLESLGDLDEESIAAPPVKAASSTKKKKKSTRN